MPSTTRRPRAAVPASLTALLAALALALTACGGGDGDGGDDQDIGVGDEFTFQEFTVAEGWTLERVQRDVAMEKVDMAEVRGKVTNTGEEAKAPIFELVFAEQGEEVASITCSSRVLEPEETGDLLCPALRSLYPEEFDTIVPQPYEREG